MLEYFVINELNERMVLFLHIYIWLMWNQSVTGSELKLRLKCLPVLSAIHPANSPFTCMLITTDS